VELWRAASTGVPQRENVDSIVRVDAVIEEVPNARKVEAS
jgi:hypothetical protein